MSSTTVELLYGDSLAELNVIQPGASVPAAMGVLCIRRLNQLFDNWNAMREAVWTDVFASFTLTAALTPHTIGPTGATWAATQRPVTIDAASLNLNTQTPNVYLPIDLIDQQTYESISIPGMSTSIPTALYYEKDWPNGKLFFWPVPNTAYGVRLSYRVNIGVVAAGDTLNFPQGYESAIMLTLAESLATPLGRAVPDETKRLAREARARIFGNNVVIPLLNLRDGQQQDNRNTFNYLSRTWNP